MDILIFILITTFFLLATGSVFHKMWVSIQQGHWGQVWQQQLRKWDLAGKSLLFRTMGGCAVCTSHAWGWILSIPYMVFLITQHFIQPGFIWGLLLFGGYVSISTAVNQYFITKLFQ